MKWQDHGIILNTKPWGEQHLLVSAITPEQGRHLGLVRQNKKNPMLVQSGNFASISWSARLHEHLGCFTIETSKTPLGMILGCIEKISALSAACILLDRILPERHPYPELFGGFQTLVANICESDNWYASYLMFELDLLKYLGFGLDFYKCAVTGNKNDLYYLSPKTGRAVTFEVGKPYEDRLFRIPEFILHSTNVEKQDFQEGLAITGFFIKKYFFENTELPIYRKQLYRYTLSMKQIA